MGRERIRGAIIGAAWSTLRILIVTGQFLLRALVVVLAVIATYIMTVSVAYLILREVDPDAAADMRAVFWEWWETFRDWVIGHDQRLDELTVWSFFVGLGLIAVVELITFLVMFGTHDETPLGSSLKTKKLGYALITFALSLLYGMTLVAYYHEYQFNIWERLGIRLLGILGILVAVPCAIIFVCILVYQQHKAVPALLQGTSDDVHHEHTDQGQGDRQPGGDIGMGDQEGSEAGRPTQGLPE